LLSSLGEVLEQGAANWGSKTALITDEKQLSYAELDELSGRFASGLKAYGVQIGDRVTLYASNSWQWVVCYYGALKAGAVINPVNMMLTHAELEFVLRDCGSRVLLTSADKAAQLPNIHEQSGIEHMIVFGGDAPKYSIPFNDIIDKHQVSNPVFCDPLSLSTIAYTSGTTGHPKGAMLSHRSVILSTEMTALMYVRTENDVVVTALPCPHVYGNVVMNGVLMHGGTLVLHSTFDACKILDSIKEHSATMLEGVPTMYFYILGDPGFKAANLSSLTRCSVGGQAMPVSKHQEIEKLFGCPLLELWGMTEMAGPGTTHPFYGKNRHGSIGIPVPYIKLRISDSASPSKTIPPGEVGELLAAGPHIMMGYYGNEQATKDTLTSDGWLHTGDLAYCDSEGFFYIVDRKKDMILTAGYNVYPAEIERVISAHPAVAMVGVGAVKDELKGELAKAYVVLKAGATITEKDLITFCRLELASYKVPRAVKFVANLPKTSSGKIMRRALASLDDMVGEA